jgi:hypothetical protein
VFYQWNGAAWVNISTSINPSWGNGSNGLGIQDGTTFIEFKLPLSVLGVSAGNAINAEWWMTQDGTTKGPLDAVCSDTSQASTPSGTIFDFATGQTRTMDCMIAYTILSASDAIPPVVSAAAAVAFPLNTNKQFGLNTNKVDVTFSEPVDLTSAQTTGNYALTGPINRSIIDATRDPAATNVVHLTLSGSINANAAVYDLTVTGVKDLANNTIVANGTTNVGKFFIHNLAFEGSMKLRLCKGEFAPADSFSIEGSLLPLTFALTDNAVMYDADSDSVYTVTVPFCLPFNADSGKGVADLEWKFGRKAVPSGAQQFEDGGNRQLHMTSESATQTVTASWNNDDPVNFTSRAVDVIFRVDASAIPAVGDSVVSLAGSTAPLAFSLPGLAMADNGVAPDQVAGDGIYAVRVTFPSCAPKNVEWKVGINDRFECLGQGNRSVWLNDALFSSANPIDLPARKLEFCTVSDKGVTVVFRVNMAIVQPGVNDTVAVMGDVAPLSFDFPAPTAAVMKDDGVGHDAQAGDQVYTAAVAFPQGSNLGVAFKYALNRTFECTGFGNRFFTIDDVNHSVANPQVRLVNAWDFCSDPTGVPFGGPVSTPGASFAAFEPGYPNPFGARTALRFTLRRGGAVTLRVYDVTGRLVRTLHDGVLAAGPYEFAWDGVAAGGLLARSGIYVCELASGGERLTRRMVLAR